MGVLDTVMEVMVLAIAMEVIMARERLMLSPRLRLRLVTMDTMDTVDMVTEATDMVITMAREMLRLVIMVVTEAMDIMDIMVTEAMDMVIMDKSKVSFIQTVLSSESELRII